MPIPIIASSLLRSSLNRPDKYSEDEITDRILKRCRYNYKVSLKELHSIGANPAGVSFATSAARATMKAIKQQKLLEEKEVVGAFQNSFDNLLLKLYTDHAKHYKRIERFWHQCFREYLDAKDFRKACFDAEARLFAFNDAELGFYRAIKAEDFSFKHSAAALFQRIFHNKCIDQLRRLKGGAEKTRREAVDLTIAQLPADVAASLAVPPHGMDNFDLKVLKRHNPDCFELLSDREVHGYTLEALAQTRNKTIKQIRKAIKDCLQIFRRDFGKI